MQREYVILSCTKEEEALVEGARSLGLDPGAAAVRKLDSDVCFVSAKDARGQFRVVVAEDKLQATVEFITPPFGNGPPVAAEEVERSLSDLKILFGIDRKTIAEMTASVSATGRPRRNVRIASGEPPIHGNDAWISMEIGPDAVNKDPRACTMVKPGQVLAIKRPPTKGKAGRSVFGKEIPAKNGADIHFSAGENVAAGDGGTTFVASVYGEAHVTPTGVSVSSVVELSPDKMWAQIPLFPVLADNGRLSIDDVMAALKKAGVVHGIEQDRLEAALATGERVEHFITAEGTPPKNGVDARIAFMFRLNGEDPSEVDARRKAGELKEEEIVKEFVLPGAVLARKTPLQRPVAGSTVTGITVKGVEACDRKVAVGPNVTLLEDGLTYVASRNASGYADYIGGTLRVWDPIRVSEDRMSAFLTVHPPSGQAESLSAPLVERLLKERGVLSGVSKEAIEQTLREATSSGVPILDRLIAQGAPPERGEDGRVEFRFQSQKSSGTLTAPDGKMDYRERHAVQNVKAGDVIAVRIPPTSGREGVDVLGRAVTPGHGTERMLVPVGNVSVSDDGLTYVAEIDGMVSLVQEKIGVFKEYRIAGDVDYSSGNLEMDGSLDVRGWIRSGFTVKSKGDLRVGEGIEDAVVETGTNLYVSGGAMGSGEGKIRAGGEIRIRFLENADVHADGDIIVNDYMLGSRVKTGGRIIMTGGKGCIRGGSAEALKGVEVKELGSEAGLKTVVAAGEDPSKLKNDRAEASKTLGDLRQKREKVETVLSRLAGRSKAKPIPRDTLQNLVKLNKVRQRIALYETRLVKLQEETAREIGRIEGESVAVKVEKAVYPGTTVIVKGISRMVNEDIRGRVSFVFSPEQGTVEIVPQKRG